MARAVWVGCLALAACAPPADAPDAPVAPPTLRATASAAPPVRPDPRSACAAKTAAYIAVMPGRLDVDLFVSQDQAPIAEAARPVHQALTDIAARAGGKLAVQLIDASTYAGRTLAEQQGMTDAPGFFGLVVRNGDAKLVVPALSPDHVAVIESAFSRWTRRVGAEVESHPPAVGIIGGPFAAPVQAMLDALPYPSESIEPAQADARLRTLLVSHDARLDETALRHIDAHVMRGGRLLVLASGATRTAGGATVQDAAIAPLLSAYGVKLQRALIVDPSAAYTLTLPASTEVQRVASIPIVDTLAGDFPPLAGLRALSFPFASPLSVERRPGVRVVATTSAAASAHEAVTLDAGAPPAASLGRGPFAIAAAVEGVVDSAFSATKSRDTRLFVIASPVGSNPWSQADDVDQQFLARVYARRHLEHTALALEGALEWLHGDDNSACRALAAAHADRRAVQRPFQRCAPAQVRQLLDQSRDVDHVLDVCGGFEAPAAE